MIFNKPFICAASASRGNSRFALFEQLGLKNRIMKREELNLDVIDEKIDWNEVNKRLEKMRENSLAWLSKAFDRYMKR